MKAFRSGSSWFGSRKKVPPPVHTMDLSAPTSNSSEREPPAPALPPGDSSIRILPIMIPDETGEPSEQSQQEVACLLENFALRHGSLFWPQMMRSVDIHKGDDAVTNSMEDCDILHVCGEPWPVPLQSMAMGKDSGMDGAQRTSRSSIGGEEDWGYRDSASQHDPVNGAGHSNSHHHASHSFPPALGSGPGRGSRAGSVASHASRVSAASALDDFDGFPPSTGSGKDSGGRGGSGAGAGKGSRDDFTGLRLGGSTGASSGAGKDSRDATAGGGEPGGGRTPRDALSQPFSVAGSASADFDGVDGPPLPSATSSHTTPYTSLSVMRLVQRLGERSRDSAPAIVVLNAGMSAHFAARLVAAVPSLHVIAWASPVESDGCLEFTASFYAALPDILAAELVEFEKTSVSTAMVYSAYNSAMNRMRSRGFVALDPTPYVRRRTRPQGDAAHLGYAGGPPGFSSGFSGPGGGGPPSLSASGKLNLTATAGPDGSMQATSFAAFTSLDLAVATVRDGAGRALRPFGVPVFVTSLDCAHGHHPAFSASRLLRRNIISPEQFARTPQLRSHRGEGEYGQSGGGGDEDDSEADALNIITDHMKLLRMAPEPPLPPQQPLPSPSNGAGAAESPPVAPMARSRASTASSLPGASESSSAPPVSARGASSNGSRPGSAIPSADAPAASTAPPLPSRSYDTLDLESPPSPLQLRGPSQPANFGPTVPAPSQPAAHSAEARLQHGESRESLGHDETSAVGALSARQVAPGNLAATIAAGVPLLSAPSTNGTRSPASSSPLSAAFSDITSPGGGSTDAPVQPVSARAHLPPPVPPTARSRSSSLVGASPPQPLSHTSGGSGGASSTVAAVGGGSGGSANRSRKPGLDSTNLDAVHARLSLFTSAVDISLDRSAFDSELAYAREVGRLCKFVETGAWTNGRPKVRYRVG